jgi:hypothetical protein
LRNAKYFCCYFFFPVQNDEELAAELQALQLQEEQDISFAVRLSEVCEDTHEDEVNLDQEAIVADLHRTFPAECPIMLAEYDKVWASHITWWLPTLAETAALWVIEMPGKHPQ